MPMFERFNRYKKEIVLLDGTKEKAVFTRTGRSNGSNFKNNFVFTVLLSDNTALNNGMLFTCGTKTYLTVSVRRSATSIQATVYECNCEIEIYRATANYDEYDNLVDNSLTLVYKTPANYVTTNATMRLLDAGLLPSTVIEFRLPLGDVKELDRIILNGKNYCVDVVDTTKFYGMYAVQVSYDERSL